VDIEVGLDFSRFYIIFLNLWGDGLFKWELDGSFWRVDLYI
tara:strand:+ start:308 stop:430 length:123 start_codon:yes stop_codon:yes gene_type:complete